MNTSHFSRVHAVSCEELVSCHDKSHVQLVIYKSTGYLLLRGPDKCLHVSLHKICLE